MNTQGYHSCRKNDILVYLKEAIKMRGWIANDNIDFLSDRHLYIYNLVDTENYTIDFASQWLRGLCSKVRTFLAFASATLLATSRAISVFCSGFRVVRYFETDDIYIYLTLLKSKTDSSFILCFCGGLKALCLK